MTSLDSDSRALLQLIISDLENAQRALHDILSKDVLLSSEVNDIWGHLDKAELIIRRILQ